LESVAIELQLLINDDLFTSRTLFKKKIPWISVTFNNLLYFSFFICSKVKKTRICFNFVQK